MVKFTTLKVRNMHSKVLNDTLDDVLDDVLDDKTIKQIIVEIKKNPKVKQKDLALKLNISIATLQRLIKLLIQNNIIERIGGKRFGQWIIKK